MNNQLTDQIIRHIFHCLGVKLPNKHTKIHSIMQGNYLLNQKISFEDGEQKSVWGVEAKLEEDMDLQMVLADLSENNIPEFALVVALKGSPTYAAIMCYKEFIQDDLEADRPMIACRLAEGNFWAECNVYMQGAFLCGMEKLKETQIQFSKLEDGELYQKLISFLEFYQETMEKENEG